MHIKTMADKARKLGHKARNLAVVAGSAVASAAVMAQTATALPDASTQIAEITAKQGGYASVMFTLALTAVGILVGVKWIKRGRAAA